MSVVSTHTRVLILLLVCAFESPGSHVAVRLINSVTLIAHLVDIFQKHIFLISSCLLAPAGSVHVTCALVNEGLP